MQPLGSRTILISTFLFLWLTGIAQTDTVRAVQLLKPYQRNTFAHRCNLQNTAAPSKKGSLNYYNYMLIYNELEYACTNRITASLGFLFFFDGVASTNTRLRYRIPINQRLSAALVNDFVTQNKVEFSYQTVMMLTYHEHDFVASLGVALFRSNFYNEVNNKNSGVFGNILWFPRRNGVFGLTAESTIFAGAPNPFFASADRLFYGNYSLVGFALRGKRLSFHASLARTVEDNSLETLSIPLISVRARLGTIK